ncbi:MAG: glutamine-hydrolyzing GMP synthase [Gammaproteobacteria bacterium RIFCSPHIGHO2_12_FULL_35_23]|nr:MAG: glutamine-hydrolyzing GMP synthase [Gammaproteobacteria bacterium RIFCSPHIGHO2_12_FULL_35_23]
MLTVDIHKQRILIIDFGSQYTQLIARRVREAGVYCEVFSYKATEKEIKEFNPRGIILSGGPETVTAKKNPTVTAAIYTLGCPILGICYGMQIMAKQLGGKVVVAKRREFGAAEIILHEESELFKNIQDSFVGDKHGLIVWMSHGDEVSKLPKEFKSIASTQTCPIAAIADEARKFYGLQFHPEVTHTQQGQRIISSFVHNVCGCEAMWTVSNIIENSIIKIRAEVGNEQVLLALSGGVDSSVVAMLMQKAIGEQLVCVFVDTGLLRLNEADEVMQTFAKHLGINVYKVDASAHFFAALVGITDPEQKRKICGKLFIDIFEAEAERFEGIKWLAQGTIYPDVIESSGRGKHSHLIKSHHNVGGLPNTMQLKLIEPLRELFKDEVRKVGLELGLAAELLNRHPFPGPGLVVRILGEVKVEYADILCHADAIFIEELKLSNFYDKISQAFAVFLPVRSVAVMGDARKHEYVVALRAVETVDFMTAHWAQLPHELLAKVSLRICNEVPHVARVVYDITGKPPATIEWE